MKVRIYPNKQQEIALNRNLGCARFVWNYYLNKTNSQYQETGKGMTYCQMAKDLTQLKKLSDYDWLTESTAATLQQALKNLESAFKNFFEKRAKFPKFKSKHKKQSLRYPESCSIRKGGLKLPKIGVVKAKITRQITGKIKSVTLSKTSTDKYFASILFETDDLTVNKEPKISGIDLGLLNLVTVFDGEKFYKVDPIKPTRKYAKRLRRRQQALSRKAQGSRNRKKAIYRVAKVHEKISNTRQDFLHKLSRKLCDENKIVVAENLNIKGLARTKLAKSIHDAGFGMLLNFLGYKLEREGGSLIEVDRFFPSTKLCSCCNFKNDLLTLSIRDWVCPECQTHHDRDENAAKNLRQEGLRILSENTAGQSEFQACGETVRLVNTCIKQQVSMNQESPATLP
ncbi:MAG: RNA-guided endonuclease InsQ/TnpB family protein [Crocosphaera sp.]